MPKKLRQISDQVFLKTCYERILGRNPDKESYDFYLNSLLSKKISREELLYQLILCEEFKSKVSSQEFVPPGHFYSAVPSIEERNNFISSVEKEINDISEVEINKEKQLELLRSFKKYHDTCPFPHEKNEKFRYYFLNPAYSYSDGLTLYSMIRHFNPENIIEIGSGFSSCVMLDTNHYFYDNKIEMTFIEPYPELLFSLIKPIDRKHLFIEDKVQNVDVGIYSQLKENDFLFVDSTHVSKLNSDVNKIIFEIIPSLNRGVIIHFHDIFWPFEYPKEWIHEGRAWNEAYILHAFLSNNKNYEILFFSDYLHKFYHDLYQIDLPLCLSQTGGNLWIRKL